METYLTGGKQYRKVYAMDEIMKEATAIALAEWFHETYEELAPQYGYITKAETAIPWNDIPDDNPNKQLMIAVCRKLLSENFISYGSNGMGEQRDTTVFGQ